MKRLLRLNKQKFPLKQLVFQFKEFEHPACVRFARLEGIKGSQDSKSFKNFEN